MSHSYKDEPSKELEEELKKNPHDADKKVDVGSDESMDASDPVSASRSDDGEPHPSSNAPKPKPKDEEEE